MPIGGQFSVAVDSVSAVKLPRCHGKVLRRSKPRTFDPVHRVPERGLIHSESSLDEHARWVVVSMLLRTVLNARSARSVLTVAVLLVASACAGQSSGPNTATTPTITSSAPTSTSPTPSGSPRYACVNSDLRVVFSGVQLATGNDFGSIVAWNPTGTPCQVSGPVSFAAFYPGGRRDPRATINGTLKPVNVTLHAGMPTFHDGEGRAGYLTADLMGPERDDPQQSNGLCRARDEHAPAILRVQIGSIVLRVRNHDPHSPASIDHLYGCHGQVLLERVGRAD